MRALAFGLVAQVWFFASAAAAGSVTRTALPNGMTVAVSPRAGGEVSACLTVKAGSGSEQADEAGAAAALARALAPEDFELGVDQTRWCVNGKSSELDAVLAKLAGVLTAAAPAIAGTGTPDADQASRTKLRSLAYQGVWALDHDPLEARTEPALLQRFRARSYTAQGAILGLAGQLPANWLEIVARRFARAPSQPPPLVAAAAVRQTSPRFMRFQHSGAGAHVLYFGWAIGPAGSAEHSAMVLLAHALASGDSATLRTVFVKQRGMLRELEVRVDRGAAGNLFSIRLELKSNVALAPVESLLSLVLARIRLSGLSAAELSRARAALEQERQAISADDRTLAAELSSPHFAADTPVATAADVKRAAALLSVERQNLVELVPPHFAPPPAAPTSRVYVVKRGDTLTAIARRHKVSVEHLIRKNGLSRAAPLRIGQRLRYDPPRSR